MRYSSSNVLSTWPSTDLSSSINGPWFKMGTCEMASFLLTWTNAATLNGVFKIQTSVAPVGLNDTAPTNSFSTLEGSEFTMTSGVINGDTNLQINISACPFTWARVVWTATSGTGTLSEAAVGLLGV